MDKRILMLLLVVLVFFQARSQSNNDWEASGFHCTDLGKESIVIKGLDSEYLRAINDSTFISQPGDIKYVIPSSILQDEKVWEFKYQFKTKTGIYLVHAGGGVVLHYNGDKINRIDDSFYHHNQYNAQPFTYQDDLYLFSGQGLFTRKNILTKYDFALNEWVAIKQSGKIPEFSPNAGSIKVGNQLFLVTGHSSNREDGKVDHFLFYSLDFTEMRWTLLGQCTSDFRSQIGNDLRVVLTDTSKNKLIIEDEDKNAFVLDISENTFNIIEANYPFIEAPSVMFNNSDTDYALFYCDNKSEIEKIVVSEKELYSGASEDQQLYESNLSLYYEVVFQVMIGIFILILVLILFREFRIDNRIIIRMRNASFIYRFKRLRIFNEDEVMFFESIAMKDSMSFQELEDLLSTDMDSQVTRTKSRERFMRILNAKLRSVFNLEQEETGNFIHINSQPHDKRSKYYTLSNHYFKIM
ncbi:MAG: hypothetical protein ACPGZQ_08140 [Flavobacteriaceae bacterium]